MGRQFSLIARFCCEYAGCGTMEIASDARAELVEQGAIARFKYGK